VICLLAASCATVGEPTEEPASQPVAKPAVTPLDAALPEPIDPSYLDHWPGLFAREDGRIVRAPPADVRVAKAYPAFGDKGPLTSTGERLTIMTAKSTYAVGEPIRVVHVYEASRPGVTVYVMGPKAIFGETINGEPVTPPEFEMTIYDGLVLDSPALDYNYEVTEYRLPRGTHEIRWSQVTMAENSPRMTSNTLTVRVE
jgi:hypothetical protein